jgi:hypothetical protein
MNGGTTTAPNAGSGFFPLDQQLQLIEKHRSEGISKLTTWLCGQLSYEDAAEVLERVGGIHLSDTTAWRTTQQWGEQMKISEAQQAEEAQQKPVESAVAFNETDLLGAALDGVIMYVREEGWKELKLGCVFQVEPHSVQDERLGEAVVVGHAVQQSYVAHLGSHQGVGKKLFAEARRRNWLHTRHTQFLGDGASWIWNLAEEYFGGSEQTVDWYHAKEHLFAACHTLHAPGSPAAARWMNQHTELLFQGHADQIAHRLREAEQAHPGAANQAGYFDTNHRRMNYMALREQGWMIGSGMIESGGKQFKARFAGPGMRWSRSGAERLLPIRAAILGKQFDRLWHAVYNSPPN